MDPDKKTIEYIQRARDGVLPSKENFTAALAAIPLYRAAHKGERKNSRAITWSDYPITYIVRRISATSVGRELRVASDVTANGVRVVYAAAKATPRAMTKLANRAWERCAKAMR